MIQTRRRASTQSNEGQFFLTFTFASSATMSGYPGFSLSLPSGANTNGTFSLWLYDPTKAQLGWQVIGGPIGGASTVTFAPATSPQSFTAGVAYVFALVFMPNAPTPTPAPTASATPTPDSVPALTTATFTLPQGTSGCVYPSAIAVGPDGNLWISTTNGAIGCISKYTTAGTATQYPLPGSPARSPGGITAGPDDAVWFTETAGNLIGRIDTLGNITEYSATNSGGPIVRGSDGNLWFPTGSQIVGFSPQSHAVIGTVTLPASTSVIQLISNPANGAVLAQTTNNNVGYIYAFAPGASPSVTQVYSNAGLVGGIGGVNSSPSGSLAVGGSNLFALVSAPQGGTEIAAFSQSTYAQSSIPLPTSFTFQGGPFPTAFSSPLVVTANGDFFMPNGCSSWMCRGRSSSASFYDATQITASGVVVGQGAGWPRLQVAEFVEYFGATVGPDGSAWFILTDPMSLQGFLERVTPNAH